MAEKGSIAQKGLTDRRSMAGTAPTDSDFHTTLNAGPVHCSVWLAGIGRDRRGMQDGLHKLRRRQVVMGHHVVVNHRRRREPCPARALDPYLTVAYPRSLRGADFT